MEKKRVVSDEDHPVNKTNIKWKEINMMQKIIVLAAAAHKRGDDLRGLQQNEIKLKWKPPKRLKWKKVYAVVVRNWKRRGQIPIYDYI